MFTNSASNPDCELKDEVHADINHIMRRRGTPRMMESLRLIVGNIIADLHRTNAEALKTVTQTEVLMALASRNFASFEAKLGRHKWVWRAAPALISWFNSGRYGVSKRTNRCRPKIRLDALLTKLIGKHIQFGEKMGPPFNDQAIPIRHLLRQEEEGLAVPYLDDSGELAWKASVDLRRESRTLRFKQRVRGINLVYSKLNS